MGNEIRIKKRAFTPKRSERVSAVENRRIYITGLWRQEGMRLFGVEWAQEKCK